MRAGTLPGWKETLKDFIPDDYDYVVDDPIQGMKDAYGYVKNLIGMQEGGGNTRIDGADRVSESMTPSNVNTGRGNFDRNTGIFPGVTDTPNIYGGMAKKGGEFKPHMMYDPKTGKGYMANKMEDHLRMADMGYLHEDEMKKAGKKMQKAEYGGPKGEAAYLARRDAAIKKAMVCKKEEEIQE